MRDDEFWADWDAREQKRREQEALVWEQERRTMAHLLRSRGHLREAALVAMSEYARVCVDDWDGGQYATTLAVPAEAYDLVTEDVHQALAAAASALVGDRGFRGFEITVRLAPAEPGWDRELVAELVAEFRRVGAALGLPAGIG